MRRTAFRHLPRRFVAAISFALLAMFGGAPAVGADVRVAVATPMAPPAWAALERALLEAQVAACREYFSKYFDERGALLCVERWGGDDGPDDAIENLSDWPILHALGADDEILNLYKKGWEGHLRQYTLARTSQVPFARDGMYYKEFPVMFDWVHNGEGLTVFNLQGLSDSHDRAFASRVRRFAGFYMNEDPGAPNYDPQHKIIRSLFNGSRGPLLRKATALDWAGDPIDVENRFRPLHGEKSYKQMLEHFEKYNDVVGDHPQNLEATSLAFNAFALTHQPKYKRWLLDYVDAWVERTRANNAVIPTNVGLDGVVGSATGGKWYGGVYGWGFSVRNPTTGELAHRNMHHLALTGFGNAFLLTGDRKYPDTWRAMIDAVNAQGRMTDGKMTYPTMYGDEGWYAFTPAKYAHGALQIWYWTMNAADRERIGANAWLDYLDGKNADYPYDALRQEFLALRERVDSMRSDPTVPDTRLADDPMAYNPATVQALVNLMLGGLHPGHVGSPLHCRVRYFDPLRRRAGLPKDVAALVDRLTDTETGLTLVNVSPVEGRTVVVQAGAYGEHRFMDVTIDGKTARVDSPSVTVDLAPGCGARLLFATRRYANVPTLLFPWDPSP